MTFVWHTTVLFSVFVWRCFFLMVLIEQAPTAFGSMTNMPRGLSFWIVITGPVELRTEKPLAQDLCEGGESCTRGDSII